MGLAGRSHRQRYEFLVNNFIFLHLEKKSMIIKYKHFVYFLLVSVFSVMYGQSIQDLQKLKGEYDKFQKGQSKLQLQTDRGAEADPLTGVPMRAQISPYKPNDIEEGVESLSLEYFGYDFFTRRDTVSFWESLPTPANYLLGPGDELVISLWGETQLRETYTISRDGKIYDEKVGLLNLTGKSINDARQYLKDQYARIYATLKVDKATTFMDVSLGELRSINVNFVGQVNYPGVFPIHPFSNVITGLIQAGGVDTTGSLRSIKIMRAGLIKESIDLYDYFINGDISSNIQLRDQDIIVIPPRSSFVEIDSAVVNPGIYESIPGETIYNMIQHAGGQKHNASEKVGIHKIKRKSKIENGMRYEAGYVDFENTKLILADRVDRIVVRPLFIENLLVEVMGQVKTPGLYHYYKGMTLKNLLTLSGGFEDSTFWKSVYHDRAEIIRRDPDSRYERVIKVNLVDIYFGKGGKDILLQNLDRVVVHANKNYFEKENIYISGEVNIPGSYPLISDNETLLSILSRSGNLTSKALKNGISIYRDKKYFEVITGKNSTSLNGQAVQGAQGVQGVEVENNDKVRVAWQKDSIALMPGDSVVVKETTGTVNVAGQVYNPGLIEFRKGKSLRKYINSAGGITENGNQKNVIVVYANGLVSPKKWYSSPKIEDGATIIVNKKVWTEPVDITQLVTNWTSIIASMITAIVLTKQL